MKFETGQLAQVSQPETRKPENTRMQPNLTHSDTHTKPLPEELSALQTQNRNLRVLVGELLVKNEQLRLQLAQREMAAGLSATATPPLPRPDR